MPVARVTSKGQITIPVEVRSALGLNPGSRVQFVRLDGGSYEMIPATRSVSTLASFLAPAPRTLTIEQMDDAAAEGLASVQKPGSDEKPR